jgi:uncharacterized membrane protein
MMLSLPLLAVLGASLALSGFDLARKLLSRRLAALPMVGLLATASVPLFAGLVAVGGFPDVRSGYLLPAVCSVVLNLGAHLAFLEAVRLSPLSLTVPLLSLTPVFTAVAGFLILGERPTSAGITGIVLVVAGAFWLHRPSIRAQTPPRDRDLLPLLKTLLREPGAWLMNGAALLWSLSLPLDKMAVTRSSPAFHGLVLTAGIAFGAFGLLALRGQLRELQKVRDARGMFVLALLTSTLALGLQLVAVQWVLVSLLETAKRGVGNVAAVVLGRSVFREPLSFAKIGAALLMSVGVALILL